MFVDTGGFYALADADDEFHEKSCRLFEKASAESWALMTTNCVVAETHALVLCRLGRKIALGYLQGILAGSTLVERVTEEHENDALQLLVAHDDKNYSFCDATSFIIMEQLKILEVIAFDDHFRQYGKFIIL